MNSDYLVKGLHIANIVVSGNCNSKCVSCSYWKSKDNNELDVPTIRQFFSHIKEYGVERVLVTGGEPTVHSEIVTILRMAKEDFGFIVILATNGILLHEIYHNICRYVDSYCISFDSCNNTTYKKIRGVDKSSAILEVTRYIRKHDAVVQLWYGCLIQKHNYLELIDIYDAAREAGADGIYFNVPELRDDCFGRNGQYALDEQDLLIPEEELRNLSEIFNGLIANDSDIGFLCQDSDTFTEFLRFFRFASSPEKARERACEVYSNSITLTENNRIKPCFFVPDDFCYNQLENPVNATQMLEIRKKTVSSYVCSRCYQYL